ncbi:MAG: outer membrane beta-barrel protein, partial [Muriicola sp.]|nr:outer membrane beta-barrel protein [Muriicola sp.]
TEEVSDKEPAEAITDTKSNDSEVVAEKDSEEIENVQDDQKVYTNNESKDAILNPDKSVETTVASENKTSEKKNINAQKDPILRDMKIVTNPNEKRDAVVIIDPNLKKADDKTTAEKKALDKIADPDAKKVETEKIAKTEVDKKNEASTDPLINKESKISDKKIDKAVVVEENKELDKEEVKAEEKKSIYDAIEENKEVAVAIAIKEGPDNRWEVTPNVGPVYYSSFGNGSSIDPSFADNSQSGDVNFSYGAAVSYAISEKLSLRTGISNVNLSYSTGGLELGTGPTSAALKSVNYGKTSGQVLTAVDKGSLRPNPEGGFGVITPKAGGAEAFLNQKIRYYEVPMELKYSLLDNKFGINMIGGFSTLFLGNNEVSVEAGDFRSVLGEANNLNSLSFTTNIGLGFDYKITNRLKFNIEPIFKYQLNPYSDSSVDFNPFYMGVYTGLSFKF